MTKPLPKLPRGSAPASVRQRIAGVLVGVWLAVVPVKFGNPVIFDHMLGVPQDVFEMLLGAWPISWSYGALGVLAVAAVLVWRSKIGIPSGLLALLLAWFGWTLVSAIQTVNTADAQFAQLVCLQFAGCVVCFGAGLLGMSHLRDWRSVWLGMAIGLLVILGTALEQHFGGLERTRQAFETLPQEIRARMDTPEFRKKIISDRVFGTFVYPNALAGGLLLLLPLTLAGIRQLGFSAVVRGSLCIALGIAGVAVLYWSGSKSGWLIALMMAGIALWRVPAQASLKLAVLIGLVGLGSAAFLSRHGAYFEKGASSLSARLDYWRIAGQMIHQKPWMGYGPGAFQRHYAVRKPADAEMARLAHNDFLQQGCDSGIPALITYTAFIFGSILLLYRRSLIEPLRFAGWLGVLGFGIQSLTEFGLYIPGLAWAFFLVMGWLWSGQPNEIDNPVRLS